MAHQAIQQKDGIQVNGYNDYRGIPVVGAWIWIPELNIGLTTEVDVAEAFRPLKTLMTWFFFLFGLLVFMEVSLSPCALVMPEASNRRSKTSNG